MTFAFLLAACALSPLEIPPVALVAVATLRFDDGDDQYQFIVGLCDKGMFEMAATEAEGFLKQYGKHPKAELARYRLACAWFEIGKKQEAAPQFAKLAARDGFEFAAESAFRLGQCELDAKHFKEARQALDRVARSGKDYLITPALFLAGEAAFQDKDFAAAEKSYLAALERMARDAKENSGTQARDARYGLAWARFRQKDFAGAIGGCRDFLRVHGQDALAGEIQFLLGEANLEAKQPNEALAAYASVKDGPFADAALRGTGFAQIALGDTKKAASAFAKLLERFPDSRFAQEAALQCGALRVQSGDFQGAYAILTSKAAGSSAETLLWRSRAQQKLGDSRAALTSAENALAAKPSDAIREQLQILRGDLLSDLGEVGKASEAYAASQSDYALHAAAIAKLNAGDIESASKLAQQLLDRFPQSEYRARAEIVLGEAALGKKQYSDADAHFAAAVKGGDPELGKRAASRLAWCAWLSGDPALGAKRFEKLAREAQGNDLDEALYMLGVCELAAKKPERAVAAWQRHLDEVKDGKHRADALLGVIRNGEPNAARTAANESIERFKDTKGLATAVIALSEKIRKAGDSDAANALLGRVVEIDASGAAAYALAYARYDANSLDEAKTMLDRSLASKQIDAKLKLAALELSVFVEAKRNDASRAAAQLDAYSRAGGDAGKRLALTRVVAKALEKAGDKSGAERLYADLDRAAQDPAIKAEVAAERAYLALDRGEVKTARALIDPIATPEPTLADEAAFFVGEALFQTNAFGDALRYYDRATRAPKLADKALYKAGFAALKSDDAKRAEQYFKTLTEQHAKSALAAEGLFLLGETRFRQDRFDDACAPLTKLRKEQPKHEAMPKALFRLGIAHGRMNRFPECEDALSELVRRYPDFPNLAEAELWRGRAFAARKEWRSAKQSLEKTIALDKSELAARARIELGRVYTGNGEHERALSEFLKVAVLFGGEDVVAESLLMAGQSLEALGDKEKAQKQYEELLTKYPKNAFAAQAKERISRIRTL